jgi:hypothetical protein
MNYDRLLRDILALGSVEATPHATEPTADGQWDYVQLFTDSATDPFDASEIVPRTDAERRKRDLEWRAALVEELEAEETPGEYDPLAVELVAETLREIEKATEAMK